MTNLSQQEWQEQLEKDSNAVIIDVRTDEELEEGFIKGAKQMNIQNSGAFYEEAQKLNPDKNYYVYCKGGGRSATACVLMNSLGIANTYNLEGGISEWTGEIVTE